MSGNTHIHPSIWSDRWFRQLSNDDKILYIYLWTNLHRGAIAMYDIDVEVIAFDLSTTKNKAMASLKNLSPKVRFDPDIGLIWVPAFLKRQWARKGNLSPKFKNSICDILTLHSKHRFVKDFINQYSYLQTIKDIADTLSIPYIPYQYSIDRVNTNTNTNTPILSSLNMKKDKIKKDKKEGEIFEHWNSLEIIRHRSFTNKMESQIRGKLADYLVDEIKQTMSNYQEILKGDYPLMTYSWNLVEFLTRSNGFDNFVDLEAAKKKYTSNSLPTKSVGKTNRETMDRLITRRLEQKKGKQLHE